MDDVELFNRTGQGRDVNRHNYTPGEIEIALKQPVVQAIIALARLRKHAAFEGDFAYAVTGSNSMTLAWNHKDNEVKLHFVTEVENPNFIIEVVTNGETQKFASVSEFTGYDK